MTTSKNKTFSAESEHHHVTAVLVFALLSALFRLNEGLTVFFSNFPTSSSALAQFKNLLQSHPCWRIFSVVEPTIWHLGDSPKYEWPIHGAQWSRLAMALLPLPPPYSKQYSAQQSWHVSPKSTKEELEAVPETLKALSLCEMQVLGTSKAI